MAKFSILRDEVEDDEEFCIRSPKRRRTTQFQNPSTAQSNPDDEQQPQQGDEERESERGRRGGEEDDDVAESAVGPTTKSGSMSVILSDPDVLDCSICFDPLTIPVFQCDNGHIACSSCCTKLANKCPSCCGSIGYNRCRAIEKVVESVKVSCRYSSNGCRETISYSGKHEHEETCIYAPCSCPFPNCNFHGSSRTLSHHVSQDHSNFVVRFCYNSIFPVSVGMGEDIVVLQEERDGCLFVLNHGNTVTLRCVDLRMSKVRFAYDLVLRRGGSSLRFQSLALCSSTEQIRDPPSMDYVLVPGYFYHTGGCLKLEICIWSRGLSHADVTQAMNNAEN